MSDSSYSRYFFLGLLGLMMAWGSVWLFPQVKYFEFFPFKVNTATIWEIGDRLLRETPLAGTDPERSTSFSINRRLMRYYQENHLLELAQSLPAAQLHLTYVNHLEKGGEEKLELHFFPDGRLAGFHKEWPEKLPVSVGGNAANKAQALAFLATQGVVAEDSISLNLVQQNTVSDEGRVSSTYVFQKKLKAYSDLPVLYRVVFAGNFITDYRILLPEDEKPFPIGEDPPPDGPKPGVQIQFSNLPEVEDTPIKVALFSLIIFWGILILMVLVKFLRRLRRDSVEFKSGLGLASLIGIWAMVALQTYPEWIPMLIGGSVAGLFVSAFVVMSAATSEAVVRESNPTRLALSDAWSNGVVFLRESGQAILTGLAYGGITLFLMVLGYWIAAHFNLGWLVFQEDDLWLWDSSKNVMSTLLSTLFTGLALCYLGLLFVPQLVQERFQKSPLRFGVLAILYLILFFQIMWLKPPYLMMLVSVPSAILWSFWTLRGEWVAAAVGFMMVALSVNLLPATLLPGWMFGWLGIPLITLPAILLIAGLVLLRQKERLEGQLQYTPNYLKRLQEQERLKNELDIARNIQFRFLPAAQPDFDGLDIAAVCEPAMEVGGDYYDFLTYDEKSLGVIIGDVSGKGVSAAFFMTLTKGILKTLARSLRSPAKLLAELNSIFFENTPRQIFISMLVGLFDLEKKQLTFARAGHNPLLVSKGRESTALELMPKGLAIGMDGGTLFRRIIEEAQVEIESGDVFLFYTDGLSEALNSRGEEFGEERLCQIVSNVGDGESAAQILHRILEEIDR
nr:PP2C family protein-serine/threonine phosphatase [Calditrichia bacterium]